MTLNLRSIGNEQYSFICNKTHDQLAAVETSLINACKHLKSIVLQVENYTWMRGQGMDSLYETINKIQKQCPKLEMI